MIFIPENGRKRIIEDSACLLEAYMVLLQVYDGFRNIPWGRGDARKGFASGIKWLRAEQQSDRVEVYAAGGERVVGSVRRARPRRSASDGVDGHLHGFFVRLQR
jgi:hypothetical protein